MFEQKHTKVKTEHEILTQEELKLLLAVWHREIVYLNSNAFSVYRGKYYHFNSSIGRVIGDTCGKHSISKIHSILNT